MELLIMNLPMVSIIVAVYNGADTLQKLLDSISGQSYPNKELIIMDGKSTDDTVDIIRKNQDNIAYWESESDKGIYHAWNKALIHAKGEWICFIGSDDYWSYPDAIKDLVRAGEAKGVDLVSGKVAMVDTHHQQKSEYGKPWSWQAIKRSHCIAHPGMLHHRTCFKRNGNYDERYRIASDYDFSLRLGKDTTSVFIDRVFVCMGNSGFSRSMVKKTLSEVKDIQSKHPEIGPHIANTNFYKTFLIVTVKKMFNRF